MVSRIKACVLQGLDGCIVEVETDLSNGLPGFSIVGLADTAIKEAKERARSSIKNSGYKFPVSKITINLAPANLKKEGSQMDLPIAVGILFAKKIIKKHIADDVCFLGELSLDGNVTKIDGALPLVISLRNYGIKKVIIPDDNKDECGVVEGIDVIPVVTLKDVVDYLNNELNIEPYTSIYINEDNYEEIGSAHV